MSDQINAYIHEAADTLLRGANDEFELTLASAYLLTDTGREDHLMIVDDRQLLCWIDPAAASFTDNMLAITYVETRTVACSWPDPIGHPMPDQPSITCPRCGFTSFHPEDIRQGYCGRCNWWTSDETLGDVPGWEAPPDPPLKWWQRLALYLGVGPDA